MLVLRPPGLVYFPALFASFSVVSSSRGIKSQIKGSNTIKVYHQKAAVTKQKKTERKLECTKISVIEQKIIYAVCVIYYGSCRIIFATFIIIKACPYFLFGSFCFRDFILNKLSATCTLSHSVSWYPGIDNFKEGYQEVCIHP